ncbi:putative non-specific serine/threonine protein kinase [Helianthus annuus]|nr:putative non-specific serine/threonine protein kinase [Helianthus annuus]KAJ0747418.1 putative non-specific serine/threonine protein kinase [Helianthus annuus]KAJ0750505.1 putative non-specific serine/threonine protein kinase [Helianthus annuus]
MMGNQWVLGLHLIFIGTFVVATTCLGARNSTASCHEQERLALLKFKDSVKDDFKMLSSWVGIDCCSWDRVHCDGATGRVASLHLRGIVRGLSSSCWVTGTFASVTASMVNGYLVGEEYYLIGEDVNSSLAELRHLKYLDLSGNDFQGRRIPEFIGSLKKLRYLNLSNAGFSGNIPHHIGNLSNLKVLALSSTTYTQTLTADDMVWISGLSSLKYLDLNGVNLSGAKNRDKVLYMIPSVIHLSLSCSGFSAVDLAAGPRLNFSRILPNIKYLQLKDNAIEVLFPSVLTNMSSLVSLDLSGNILNSSIPFMPSLLKLDLSNSEIRQIDYIGIWRQCNLKELIVSFSNLEGDMTGPSTNASMCSTYALEVLDLSLNELSCSIPKSFGRLTSLRALHLESNRLKGPIPEDLGKLRFLEVLDLSYNQLDGPIPTLLGRITELDLSHNQLNYSIPESFRSLAALTYLNLESNQLTGPIPASLGRLATLKTFSMSSNLLNGTIPTLVGQLTELEFLDVSNNSLEGEILEAHFSNLSMLKYLDLSSNRNLTLNVSRQWIPPFQLRTIRLSSCKISDEFPKWFQTQKKLDELVLSNASISGPLPTWLRQMRIISFLDLSYNKLNGPLTNLPFGDPLNRYINEYMGSLYLQNNLFNGLIPRSLCTRTGLEILDLSKNRLTGIIPNCLLNLQHLSMMILSSNGLSGVIPSFLGRISPALSWLNLNNNSFTGELPQDLGKLHALTVLDLGDNEFSGKIPEWIGEKLTRLMVLRLHKNNFSGRIPQSLCKNSRLQILDIAHNNLIGQVPRCFGELYGMVEASHQDIRNGSFSSSDENVIQVIKGSDLEYSKTLDLVFNMDLSSNKLVGQIPEELMTLSLLVGLNLSHNHLSGGIPSSIGNMKALFSLDFADNKLTGMIPPSLASLNFLSHLNLSHNNLSGKIPTGNQLQTLTDPSIYVGNRDLCGAPLPKNCSNHEDPTTTTSKNNKREPDGPKEWFYLSVVCGIATGFWGVIGVLLFKKQWRYKLFMVAEVTTDMIYVAVMVRVSKMKRKGRDAA